MLAQGAPKYACWSISNNCQGLHQVSLCANLALAPEPQSTESSQKALRVPSGHCEMRDRKVIADYSCQNSGFQFCLQRLCASDAFGFCSLWWLTRKCKTAGNQPRRWQRKVQQPHICVLAFKLWGITNNCWLWASRKAERVSQIEFLKCWSARTDTKVNLENLERQYK